MSRFDLQDWLASKGTFDRMSDEKYLKMRFKHKFGYELNLDDPKTFNEKLQWLKLYNRKPEYTRMVDKYEAKLHAAEIIGEEHIIPTLGVWEKFDDIDFSALPDKFVLKCTHDSGGLVICKDKSKFDKNAARKKINKSLRTNYYLHGREWPYKDVKPRIIAEEFMEEIGDKAPVEYKIFCFNGEPKIVLVCKGAAHGDGRTNDYCDTDLNRLSLTSLYPNSKGDLEKPASLSEMLALAKRLSNGIPQVRVDFYDCNNKIYFGELTFFHNSGFCQLNPAEWNETLGSWITLPKND